MCGLLGDFVLPTHTSLFPCYSLPPRAALTGKHDTLVRRAPGWQGSPDGQQAKKSVVTKCLFYIINVLIWHLDLVSQNTFSVVKGYSFIYFLYLLRLGPRHGEVRRAHQMLIAALLPPVTKSWRRHCWMSIINVCYLHKRWRQCCISIHRRAETNLCPYNIAHWL